MNKLTEKVLEVKKDELVKFIENSILPTDIHTEEVIPREELREFDIKEVYGSIEAYCYTHFLLSSDLGSFEDSLVNIMFEMIDWVTIGDVVLDKVYSVPETRLG